MVEVEVEVGMNPYQTGVCYHYIHTCICTYDCCFVYFLSFSLVPSLLACLLAFPYPLGVGCCCSCCTMDVWTVIVLIMIH